MAEDLKHDRKVAIKVLKPELAAILGAERFIQEIKTTAALSYPHILPLFDSGEASGYLFYVMPYIEGETIRERLDRETQLGVEEAVRMAIEVADALDYAHRQGAIHRDIKPENILLHDGRPMVMDFGIALGGRSERASVPRGTFARNRWCLSGAQRRPDARRHSNRGLNLTGVAGKVGRWFGLHLTTAGGHVPPAG